MTKQSQHAYTRPDLDALVAAQSRKGKLRVIDFATDAGRAATTHLSGVLLRLRCDCGRKQSMKWGAFHRAKPSALACTNCKRAAWGRAPEKNPEMAKGKGEMVRAVAAYAAMPTTDRDRVKAIVRGRIRAFRLARIALLPESPEGQRIFVEALADVQRGEDGDGEPVRHEAAWRYPLYEMPRLEGM